MKTNRQNIRTYSSKHAGAILDRTLEEIYPLLSECFKVSTILCVLPFLSFS